MTVVVKKTRPRGFATWKPRKKTQQLLDLVITVLADHADYLPLTIRQIFYQLVGAASYDKTEKAYGRLCETLNRARRSGLIDFGAIRDDGLTRIEPQTWAGTAEFLRGVQTAAANFRMDRQSGQPVRLRLVTESAGMAPQLARVANEYGVPVLSSGGFNSLTGKYELARELAACDAGTEILHVGDYDTSGVHVFSSLAEDLAELTVGLGGAEPAFTRLAVTEAQARDLNLPSAPPKASDKRRFDGDETWQAEAIPPGVLARIVRDAIVVRQDMGTRELLLSEEDEAREALLWHLDAAR